MIFYRICNDVKDQYFSRKEYFLEYMIWYNTKRAYKSLGNLSPIDYILKYYPEAQMSANYTAYTRNNYETKRNRI